jgi:hypothetical protein
MIEVEISLLTPNNSIILVLFMLISLHHSS